MNKIRILCKKDETMLHEFSRRCVEKIDEHVSFILVKPLVHHFMDDNVTKEIVKDRIIIEHAGSVFDTSQNIADVDIDDVLRKTNEVDREFLKKISLLPISLLMPYTDLERVRKYRIAVMVRAVFDLLGHWDVRGTFIDTVRNTYSEEHFRQMVLSILHYYNLETKVISSSIKIMPPVSGVKDMLSKKLIPIMEETAEEIVHGVSNQIFGGSGLSCQDRT